MTKKPTHKYPKGFPHTEWIIYRTGAGFGDPPPVVLIPAWDVVESDTDIVYGDAPDGPGETWVVFHSWFRGYDVCPVDWPATFGRPQSMPITALKRMTMPPILLSDSEEEIATLLDAA